MPAWSVIGQGITEYNTEQAGDHDLAVPCVRGAGVLHA